MPNVVEQFQQSGVSGAGTSEGKQEAVFSVPFVIPGSLQESAVLAVPLNRDVLFPEEFFKSGQGIPQQLAVAETFNSLIAHWQEEIGGQSSASRITGNRYYLQIIALGARHQSVVIPLILKRIQAAPEPWFLALRIITGEERVGRDTPGDFRAIADAWIKWGKQHRYI